MIRRKQELLRLQREYPRPPVPEERIVALGGQSAAGGTKSAYACVQSIADSYISVKIGNTGTAVNVAKPRDLRVGDLDGKTIGSNTFTRVNEQSLSVSGGGLDTELWITNPAYVADASGVNPFAWVLVEKIKGGTGLSVGGVAVEYQDLNEAGRYWGVNSGS